MKPPLGASRRHTSRDGMGGTGGPTRVAEEAAERFTRMIASTSRQLASVGNLAARDRSNLRDIDRRHGGRMAVQRRELHLKRLAVWVDVDHSPDVADLQTFLRDRRRQHNPVVFTDHAEISLLARIRCHEPRRFKAPIDDPDRPGDPTVATFSLRRQRAIDNIFLAMRRLDAFDDFPGLRNLAQGGNQQVRGIGGEAERLEEMRFPTIVGMGRIQKVVDDLMPFDDREMRVSQFHGPDAILPRGSALLKPCARALSWRQRSAIGSSSAHHSPSMTASCAASRQGWSQKWLHDSENRVFCTCSSACASLGGMPWAQGVAGSNPVAPTTFPICRSHIGHKLRL